MTERFKRYLEAAFRKIKPTKAAMEYRKETLIKLEEGSLDLAEIGLPFAKQVKGLVIDGEAREYTFAEGRVSFAECVIREAVEVLFE